jgi:hypothetical protein
VNDATSTDPRGKRTVFSAQRVLLEGRYSAGSQLGAHAHESSQSVCGVTLPREEEVGQMKMMMMMMKLMMKMNRIRRRK